MAVNTCDTALCNDKEYNQKTVKNTTHVEHILISTWYQKEMCGTKEFVTLSRMIVLSGLSIVNYRTIEMDVRNSFSILKICTKLT